MIYKLFDMLPITVTLIKSEKQFPINERINRRVERINEFKIERENKFINAMLTMPTKPLVARK